MLQQQEQHGTHAEQCRDPSERRPLRSLQRHYGRPHHEISPEATRPGEPEWYVLLAHTSPEMAPFANVLQTAEDRVNAILAELGEPVEGEADERKRWLKYAVGVTTQVV